LIDDENQSLGAVAFDQAMWLAWEAGLDLVEVGPNASPPVVRLLDFGKYQYEQAKAESKSRSHAPEVKEIRLTLKIGQHDFDVKKGQADRWLTAGDRVRITATLRGRELAFPGQAHALIERMRLGLAADYEMAVSRLGKRFSATVRRKK
jgi:translation initiation factor IF-3